MYVPFYLLADLTAYVFRLDYHAPHIGPDCGTLAQFSAEFERPGICTLDKTTYWAPTLLLCSAGFLSLEASTIARPAWGISGLYHPLSGVYSATAHWCVHQ